MLKAAHSVFDAVIEEHPVEPKRVVRVRLGEQQLCVRLVLVRVDPAEVVGVLVLGTPERDVQKPRGVQVPA